MTQELDDKEIKKKLLFGARWMLILRLSSQTISWLVTLAVVRFLTPADYGLNAMIEVPIELMMLLGMAGLDRALVQRRSADEAELAAVFGILLLVNGVIFLSLFFGAAAIAAYFGDARLIGPIRFAALVFVLLPLRVIPNAMLDRDFAFKQKSQAELLATILASLLSLGLAISGAGVWALVSATVVNALLRAIFLAYIRPWLIRPSFKFALAKDLMRRGSLMTLSAALLLASAKLVSLIAGPELGAEVLGYFAIAYSFALLVMSKLMPIIIQTMYPAFAHLEGRLDQAENYVAMTIEVAAIVMFPISIGLACVSENFVTVIFGEQWAPVVWPLAVLSLVTPFRMITNILTPALNALGNVSNVFWLYLAMFSMLAAGIPFALHWGLAGIVYLWVIVSIALAVAATFIAKNKIGFGFLRLARSILPALAGSVVMAVPLVAERWLWPGESGAVRLAGEILLGAVLYIVTVRMFFRNRFDLILGHLLGRR